MFAQFLVGSLYHNVITNILICWQYFTPISLPSDGGVDFNCQLPDIAGREKMFFGSSSQSVLVVRDFYVTTSTLLCHKESDQVRSGETEDRRGQERSFCPLGGR